VAQSRRARCRISKGATTVTFGEYGLQAMSCGFVTARQIRGGAYRDLRHVKRGGKLYIRIFPDKPISKKPARPEWVRQRQPGGMVAVFAPARDVRARRRQRGAGARGVPPGRAKLAVQTRFVGREMVL